MSKVFKGLWDHALQRKDSDAAIESFWRYTFGEICRFLLSMGVAKAPQGSKGHPQGSQGCACGMPGGSRALQGPPRDRFYQDNSVTSFYDIIP